MSFQSSALLLSWAAILLLALVVAGLVRQVHALSEAARGRVPRGRGGGAALGPPPGSRAPAFDRIGPGLLLFVDRDCGACGDVLAAAGEVGGPLHAIFSGPAAGAPFPGTVLDGEGDGLFADYRVPATPFAVLVGEDGRVRASEPVGSAEALRELALEAAR
ncbi:hypothetical protein AGRA3207_001436 [Actinomadura graeca]|uniref:Thioredoxin domain-containing protein n=1 Tax=Actinomadura graeca TaxID=2750812 RepID=A0ABX8QQI4_9ACTN|nr:hypothetical protein [Actinomadura graeca]QXJ20681.1 hypothetical protein AGRA3207_001436 [Actinomadura graeca]